MPTSTNQNSDLNRLSRRRFLAAGGCGLTGGLAGCIGRRTPVTPVVMQNDDAIQHRMMVTVSRVGGSETLFETTTVLEPASETRFRDAIAGGDHPIDVDVAAELENGATSTRQFRPLRDVLTVRITVDGLLFISTSRT